jgi:hypothetical protein
MVHNFIPNPSQWLAWKENSSLQGVRQGPLFPLLFLLAMEPLHLLFKKAHESNFLKRLRPNCETCKVSLYVDDATIFIHPNEQELKVTDHIL